MFHNVQSKLDKKSILNNKTSKAKELEEFCFHNMESTLWYFPQCGKYNLKFPHYKM